MPAVISSDHADPSLSACSLPSPSSVPSISAAELRLHNSAPDAPFWAVVDGFVVDASLFRTKHPGGLRKLLQTNDAGAGATAGEFSFSFSRGKNAHFPDTGKRFRAGVEAFLRGEGGEVDFPPHGSLVILGRLQI
ncbi:hypothetical protein TeGR_g2591 [Tetraparma gracilis]|uniref:Cytochrome b5 heme-binding domain-containing protein n=1 Tax=Tetraparma gracilis TaxID=2962635 RepID=A0ABQ6M596_9STRA|nr:hypothetical protein TeGR_g2591 [Tetraparma gracilis]